MGAPDIAVAAIAIGGDRQTLGVPVQRPPHLQTSTTNAFDGKFGRVVVGSDTDPSFTGRQIVHAVGRDPAQLRIKEVMHADLLWSACRAPFSAPGVLEITNQFLRLGIHRDDRLALTPVLRRRPRNVLILRIPVRMLIFLAALAYRLQAVVHLCQQMTHRTRTHRRSLGRQFLRQLAGALAGPELRRHGIATARRFQQRIHCRKPAIVSLRQALTASIVRSMSHTANRRLRSSIFRAGRLLHS